MSTKADTSYLYVLGCPEGPHKIGYSNAPEKRVQALMRDGRGEVFVVGAWPVGAKLAKAAERYAHWLLRDHHLEHEWFNVDHEAATSAVRKALEPEVIASYDRYHLIPAVVTTGPAIRNGEYITTKFPKGTLARLRSLTKNGKSQAEFIRTAVEAALLKREHQ